MRPRVKRYTHSNKGLDEEEKLHTVKIGDVVHFKSDVEQAGRVIGYSRWDNGYWYLSLENPSGFSGDYIGRQTVTEQAADDCWMEG